MDGRSRPYFCGVDRILNFQQKEALTQGIQQVVETTPIGFDSFEFQFTGHQVYIHKLDRGITLLVLANSNLIYLNYLQIIEKLKAALKEDSSNAIATFRLLAGNITLQNHQKRQSEDLSTLTNSLYPPSAPSTHADTPTGLRPPPAEPPLPASSPIHPQPELPTQPTTPSSTESSIESRDTELSLKEVLAALNHLSQFTTHYLGNTVITNYWKSTRPQVDWLNNFQVDRSAQITFSGSSSQGGALAVGSQQHQWIQEWVAAFIKRCSKVIRDFPVIIEQKALDDRQKKLLLAQ